MNHEIAEAWVRRLEKGDIIQTTGRLGTPRGARCCLGVLCDMAVEQGIIPKPEVFANHLSYDGESGILPLAVQIWAGMQSVNGTHTEGQPLSVLNDEGTSFKPIAGVIRTHRDGL